MSNEPLNTAVTTVREPARVAEAKPLRPRRGVVSDQPSRRPGLVGPGAVTENMTESFSCAKSRTVACECRAPRSARTPDTCATSTELRPLGSAVRRSSDGSTTAAALLRTRRGLRCPLRLSSLARLTQQKLGNPPQLLSRRSCPVTVQLRVANSCGECGWPAVRIHKKSLPRARPNSPQGSACRFSLRPISSPVPPMNRLPATDSLFSEQ